MSNQGDMEPQARQSESKKVYLQALRKKMPQASQAELGPFDKAEIDDRNSDRTLKLVYAVGFIIILAVQLLLVNVVFFAAGIGWLSYDQWALELFVGATLAEVFLVVRVITKNLFPLAQKK